MAKRKTPPSQVDDSSMNSSETAHSSARTAQPKARRSRAGLPKNNGTTEIPEITEVVEIVEVASASAVTEIDDVNESSPFNFDESSDVARSIEVGQEPSVEEIRVRAYHLFLQRGRGHGNDFHDWLEAERELKADRHH